jgi:hypothetical protein
MVVVIAIAAVAGSAVLLAAVAMWLWLRTPKRPRDLRQADRAFAQATTINVTTPVLGIARAGKKLLPNGPEMVRHKRLLRPNVHRANCILSISSPLSRHKLSAAHTD